MLLSRRPSASLLDGLKLNAANERIIFAVIGWVFIVLILIAVINPLATIQGLTQTPRSGDADPAIGMAGVFVTVVVFGVLVLLGIRILLRLRDRG